MSSVCDPGSGCCEQPMSKLIFLDGTQVALVGLNETLAAIHEEGGQANEETAEEINDRLEAKKNYIPSSERAHKEYSYAPLKEYKKYVKGQTDTNR